MPPTTIHEKLKTAFDTMNWVVLTATNENRKIISDDASFNKLSPSRIDEMVRGTLTNFKMAPALTASGGETIPPSRKPKASPKPGIK